MPKATGSSARKSGKRAQPAPAEESSDSEIEIVQAKKQRRVRVDWTLAEDKALLGLMEDKELDMGDRAEALAAQGFLQRSKNAVQHRWSRIKHRKLTPEQEKKMEAKKNSEQERKMEAKERDAVATKAKKNIGPANGNKVATSPFTPEEEGALVAIHNHVVWKAAQSPYSESTYKWDDIQAAMAKVGPGAGQDNARTKEDLQREMARLVERKAVVDRMKKAEQKAKDKDLRKKLGI